MKHSVSKDLSPIKEVADNFSTFYRTRGSEFGSGAKGDSPTLNPIII